jgi:hypothetical protein
MADSGDEQRVDGRFDEQRDDVMYQELEQLEKRSRDARRHAAFAGFAGLVTALLSVGVPAASAALGITSSGLGLFADVPWGDLLVSASAFAATVAGLAVLSSFGGRLREAMKVRSEFGSSGGRLTDEARMQVVELHNHVVAQQRDLHHSIRQGGPIH